MLHTHLQVIRNTLLIPCNRCTRNLSSFQVRSSAPVCIIKLCNSPCHFLSISFYHVSWVVSLATWILCNKKRMETNEQTPDLTAVQSIIPAFCLKRRQRQRGTHRERKGKQTISVNELRVISFAENRVFPCFQLLAIIDSSRVIAWREKHSILSPFVVRLLLSLWILILSAPSVWPAEEHTVRVLCVYVSL